MLCILGGFSISTQILTRPIDHSSITLEWKPHILWCCHSEIMQLPITWLCHNAKDIFYSWLGSFITNGYRRKSDQEWYISGQRENPFTILFYNTSTVASYSNNNFSFKWGLPTCPNPLYCPSLLVHGRRHNRILYAHCRLTYWSEGICIGKFKLWFN